MKRLLNFFSPTEESSYFNELKAGFFIRICLIGMAMVLAILISDFFLPNENFVVSVFSKVSVIVFLFASLFILKYKGITFAGNLFSIGIVLSLLIFMNMLSTTVDVTYKYVQSFYSIFGYIIMCVLFATRPVIILNFILALLSTTHVYLFMLKHQPQSTEILRAGYFNHTIILVTVGVVVYFSNRFMELAINRAKKEIETRELQNIELLTSEEEIRATNEELVATSDALIEANDDLSEAKEKAEESDRLKTEFLNNMSHEVRTPMNGIIGFSQLLDISDLSETSRKNYIHTIQQSSHQLLSIIDNIIEISKLGTKQVRVVEQKINLNKMLKELFVIFEDDVKTRPISLELKTELIDDQSEVYTDEIKLHKTLSNLLENAMKFTEKGSVNFGYEILKNHTLDYEGDALQFFVKDTGIGVLPEKKESIFNKFAQGDTNLSRQFGGLGLGLSIAKENAELLKGKISLESERRKGSTFFVQIPYRSAM